jgi:uncharacterized damage-inducible protein DinB
LNTHDLYSDAQMSPMVGLLHATVKYNFERLLEIVSGLSQYKIDYRGFRRESNSIAQLIRHLTVVDLHWVYRLQSKNVPAELIEHFGPINDQNEKLPTVKDIPLQVLLDKYNNVQRILRDVCLTLTDEDLSKFVPYQNENIATIRWGILHIADHSRYHQAHINKPMNELKD